MPPSGSAADTKNPPTPKIKYKQPPPPPSWWVTTKGRNVVGSGAAITAGAYFGGTTLLHAWGLHRYQGVVQLYKDGFPAPLDPQVLIRCQQALGDINIKLKNPNVVRFFCVFGMDVFHAGSTKLRDGAIIGIPKHFSYRTQSDIDKSDILVENKSVEWGTDEGQLLQDSLILSERAQKFGVAREIAMSDSHSPYARGGLGASIIMSYFMITRTVNEKFYGFLRPRSFRIAVYSLVGTFAFGAWATITDLMTKYNEKLADKTVGSIGVEYAKGGVEFYAKTLQRNVALRSLMGPSGEKTFTFYGNDVEFLRQQHVPYTERKNAMEKLVEEQLNNSSSSASEREN